MASYIRKVEKGLPTSHFSHFGLQTIDFGLTSVLGLTISDNGRRTSNVRIQTSDFKLRTSKFRLHTGRTSDIILGCLMSDLQCPMSNVQSPMSEVRYPISDIRYQMSHVRCPMSDAWSGNDVSYQDIFSVKLSLQIVNCFSVPMKLKKKLKERKRARLEVGPCLPRRS